MKVFVTFGTCQDLRFNIDIVKISSERRFSSVRLRIGGSFNIDIVRIDSESLVLQRRISSDKGFNIDIVGIGSERRPGAACFGTTEFQYRHCGNR